MARRPLLSSNRVSGQQLQPPQPLLLPSQVDSSLIVFEDDVGDVNSGVSHNSEARTSIFSSLSLSLWSDSTDPSVRRSSPASYFFAVLLRPFQRLGFWCCAGRRCCCCCNCLRVSASLSAPGPYEHADDVLDNEANDAVAAGTLRVSGGLQGPQRGIKVVALSAVPHREGDKNDASNTSASRQHRQYAPPRARSSETGLGPAPSPVSTPLVDPATAAQGLADGLHADSVMESSFTDSSASPSTVAFGRVATAPGSQLVMQRGVLMRITSDGTCTRVEDPAGFYGNQSGSRGQRHSPGTLGTEGGQAGSPATIALLGRTLQLEQPGVTAPYDSPNSESNGAAEDALNAHAASMAMHALERSRQPLSTLEELSAVLSCLAPYLPLRVESELDLNRSAALPAGDALSSLAAGSPSTSAIPAVPLSLHVLGPVQSCPTAAALRVLEDILLEDCDTRRVCLNALHCADLDMRGVALGVDEAPSLAGRPDSATGAGEHRLQAHSTAFLDSLVSPVTEDTRRFTGQALCSHHEGSSASSSLTAAAASTHVLSFLNNFVTGRGSQLATLHFTRCFVLPHDMGRLVPLPLCTVRRLRYEHCFLTPAHIDALLTLGRRQDAERRNGARGPVYRCVAFSALEELQLSGSLTLECISELLDYIEEQQVPATKGGSTLVVLRQLILPSTLVRAAQEHPFVQAHYKHISVVSAL